MPVQENLPTIEHPTGFELAGQVRLGRDQGGTGPVIRHQRLQRLCQSADLVGTRRQCAVDARTDQLVNSRATGEADARQTMAERLGESEPLAFVEGR